MGSFLHPYGLITSFGMCERVRLCRGTRCLPDQDSPGLSQLTGSERMKQEGRRRRQTMRFREPSNTPRSPTHSPTHPHTPVNTFLYTSQVSLSEQRKTFKHLHAQPQIQPRASPDVGSTFCDLCHRHADTVMAMFIQPN